MNKFMENHITEETFLKMYQDLTKRLVKLLPTEDLILELKKRKVVKMDWAKNKYVRVEWTQTN